VEFRRYAPAAARAAGTSRVDQGAGGGHRAGPAPRPTPAPPAASFPHPPAGQAARKIVSPGGDRIFRPNLPARVGPLLIEVSCRPPERPPQRDACQADHTRPAATARSDKTATSYAGCVCRCLMVPSAITSPPLHRQHALRTDLDRFTCSASADTRARRGRDSASGIPQPMPIWKADVVPSRPPSALLSVLRRGQAPRATGQDPWRPG
jgi:hypothetical protein